MVSDLDRTASDGPLWFDLPMAATPPVLLVGMHRSGTSLVARMLDDLGLFLGWRLGPDHEATYFNKLNEWLLGAVGGRWDTPEAVRYMRRDPQGMEHAACHLADRLAAPPVVEFLGPGRYLRRRSAFRLQEPWGFKDPRTSVTLDVWRRVFPQAKIVHIVRHGVDVAHSLARRQAEGQELGYRNFARHRRLFGWMGKRGWFGDAPRVAHLDGAFSLWEAYLEHLQPGLEDLDAEHWFELRYEALLADPATQLRRLAAFCGLPTDDAAVDSAVAGVRADRAFSYRRQPHLVEFWQGVRASPWMQRYGYDSPGDGA